MNYKLAKEKITKFILKKKKEGKTELMTYEIVMATKIPANIVEKIIEGFIEEGKIELLK